MSETQFYEHPLYAERQFSWAGLKALYDGEHRVLTDPRFLWLHELECGEDKAAGEKLRRIRCFRSRYLNLMEPVVSRWQSFLFRKPANIPPRIENDVFGPREFANVNGRRMGFRTFIRERIGRDYLIYGKPIVFVDTSDVEAITIADAKANPDKYTMGTSGRGNTGHVAMEKVSRATGAKMTLVPFKGAAEFMAALVGGHIDVVPDGG